MTVRLSKSKLIAYRQCPKRLWLEVNRPDLKTDDAYAQQRFAAGHQVGALAQTQYADGILIAPDNNLASALRETTEQLSRSPRKVLFEATFQAEGLLVRADLLIPAKNGWHMVEVKSSTNVKNYHIEDAAIQRWVVRRAGLLLTQTSLQLIDSKWVYQGGNDYSGLLKVASIDEEVRLLEPEVPKWLMDAQEIAKNKEPKVKMGRQCNDPFACGFQDYCSTLARPVEFPIAWLPGIRQTKIEKYEAAGIVDLRQLAAETLSDKHRKILNSTLRNEVIFEPLSAAERKLFIGTRYYLDFETIGFAVPTWSGTRPYQQVPFQWSCHVEQPSGQLSHDMFLDLSGNDPRRQFAEKLVATLGNNGPIIVYNQGFEKGIIKDLAEYFDELAPALLKLLERVVDLLPLTREHYYHPKMQGSWSIKAVLPCIAPELDYALLVDVADGGGAQDAYLEATHPDTTPERKTALEHALSVYCHRDTEAMIRLLGYLQSGGGAGA